MARLWKVFHGEPFMINPVLGIVGAGVNPVRKVKTKRSRTMARRSSSRRHMAWVRSFRKNRRSRRRARRNPYAMAGPVMGALNPRRRRSHRRRRNPVMRRRHYRRNPVKLFGLPPLMSVAYATAGFAGTAALEGAANSFLPLEWTGSTLGKYATKIGSVIGVSWLSKMILGRSASYMVGIGGGLYVLTSAIRDFAPGVIPGLSGPLNLAAYRTAHAGLGQPMNLSAYRQMRGGSQRQLGSAVFGARNTTATGGQTNVVAARFRRFQ